MKHPSGGAASQPPPVAPSAPAPPTGREYLRDTFGVGGYLARAFPGYHPRLAQVELAKRVDASFRGSFTSLLDGPCGSGKSLAYLVPGIYHAVHSSRRLVVATATIQLQEQLYTKDLPMLRKVLPWPFRYAMIKGRSNYACTMEAAAVELHRISDPTRRDRARRLLQWVATPACDGDRSRAPDDVDDVDWRRFSVTSEECRGQGCPDEDRCFYNARRAAVEDAQVIVTNMHLLAAHLRHGTVLPDFELCVIDEAHELAEAVRGFNGSRIFPPLVEKIAEWTATGEARADAPTLAEDLRGLADDVFGEAGELVEAADDDHVGFPGTLDLALRSARPLADSVMDAYRAAGRVTRAWDNSQEREFGGKPGEDVLAARLAERKAERVATHLLEGLDRKDKNLAHWAELDGQQRVALVNAPIEVAPMLRRALFDHYPATVLTSATLATGRASFAYALRTCGAPPTAASYAAPSPFRFTEQCLFVTPPMPDPKQAEAAWREAVYVAIGDTIEASGGRTLALFTSRTAMLAAAQYLRRRFDAAHPILVQGEAPPGVLAARFRAETRSSLLGLRTFMTGLDVPGEALTTVVLDRLPIAPPGDPVQDAIRARVGGERYFQDYALPAAVVTFRQIIGRVIRTTSDVGAIVVLDPRINTQAYGKLFRDAIPPMQTALEVAAIGPFLAKARARIAARGGDPR